jgi:hypothetical protein
LVEPDSTVAFRPIDSWAVIGTIDRVHDLSGISSKKLKAVRVADGMMQRANGCDCHTALPPFEAYDLSFFYFFYMRETRKAYRFHMNACEGV